MYMYSKRTWKIESLLYLDAALLALVVVRESRSFLSTQVQAVVSSCRSTNRSQPCIIAPAVAAFDAIVARTTGEKFATVDTVYPNVNDGVEGMYFIQQSVASSRENGAWLPLRHKRARK